MTIANGARSRPEGLILNGFGGHFITCAGFHSFLRQFFANRNAMDAGKMFIDSRSAYARTARPVTFHRTSMNRTHEITELLRAWSAGDSEALDKLIPLVDHELRRIAHAYMLKEKPGHTLQTTALVNEALMRLLEGEQINWQSRKHFYALVARRMRQVLIEHARAHLAIKRGQRPEQIDFNEAIVLTTEMSEELVMLDEALEKLAKVDERKAKIVEYRYFGGFTIEEVADLLDTSPATVEREWRLARSWLRREMT
ncbi:MAG TPA: sigma-70 family RNA polymerase sigma factor [Pyrinomonadaceae bacterium]|nr:sigma-70 family RNA polymerase sigma factor [Pyrinomonadaceae bacterium]